MEKAIKTSDGWCLCSRCGHKLGKYSKEIIERKEVKPLGIEIKCSTCKEINLV